MYWNILDIGKINHCKSSIKELIEYFKGISSKRHDNDHGIDIEDLIDIEEVHHILDVDITVVGNVKAQNSLMV